MAGAAERYPRGIPKKVAALLEHELALVAELRYEPYFLTVHDIVAHARSRAILCQGRGSAANSAICYCLGVTSVDPSRMELLFERFVSKERDEPPDIDIDFEHERREEVIQYVYHKYGRDRAGIAAEVICYRGRSSVRDVGKAMGLSLDQVDRLAKALEHWHRADLTPQRLREAGLSPSDPNIKNVVRIVEEIGDFPRHLSQHVGGFVISRGPLCELVPIENASMADRTVVQWDKDDLEALGILKVDLLGLGMLTATRKALDLVREHHHQEYSLATIPAEDPETYEMLCHGDAVGVFQVESRAQRAMLPRLRPRRFYDLVVEIAIVRPGPIQGGMVHPYLRRRAGEEPYDIDEFPTLREVLERTHGVPLFQEQVMRMAVIAAGFTPGEADRLRRAMGAWKKRGIVEGFYEKFVSGMLGNGYPREFAERVFDQIRGFGEYGFPESHAASFALIAYATAWLKRFHPAAFTAALLNSQPMGFYAPAQLVADAREHGVEVRAVDVNESDWDCTLEKVGNRRARAAQDGALKEHWGKPGPALRLGLRLVKGLGAEPARRIEAARAGGKLGSAAARPFASVEECAARAQLDKRAVEALVAADAFASLGLGRRGALWDALGLGEKPTMFEAVEFERFAPELAPIGEGEQVVRDYESLGLSLRRHPMWFLRPELEAMEVSSAADVARVPANTKIRVAGLVVTRQRPQTASGVVFVSIEDETGTVNLIVPPQVFERDRLAARCATALVAAGNVERQGEVVHVKAWKLWEVTELGRLRTEPRSFH
jgi:error-prone DNA polymerase